MIETPGIHHVTAVAGDPQQNLDFYAGTLGLRLVKKTVNFDDPSIYHLYYGNPQGRPGSVLSFFPWSQLQQGHPDTGQAIAVSFSVPESSLAYWEEYLDRQQVDYVEPFTRFGRQVLGFQDPDGLHLELVAEPGAGELNGWSNGNIASAHAIRGLHGITLAEQQVDPTADLLTEVLGYRRSGKEHGRILLQTEAPLGGHVEIVDGSQLDGRSGRGTVHHVAFRARDEEEQEQLREKLLKRGYHLTDVEDRLYFRSVYFHEPGGILFEIATDTPGFDTDEPQEKLGQDLQLPDWLEDRRDLIEADLPDLQHPG